MKHLSHTHCLIGIAVAVIAVVAFGVSASSLLFVGMFLACPLIMLFMMRSMMGSPPAAAPAPNEPDSLGAGHQATRATK